MSKNDWPEGSNSSKIARVRPGVGGFAIVKFGGERRYGHRDCRQKPDAFSPYDLRLTFRSGILKSIMRVITFSGLANHLVDRIPDFQLLNCEYDIVTSIKRKQMSFVAGCINAGSAELSAQILGSQRAGQKRWSTAWANCRPSCGQRPRECY